MGRVCTTPVSLSPSLLPLLKPVNLDPSVEVCKLHGLTDSFRNLVKDVQLSTAPNQETLLMNVIIHQTPHLIAGVHEPPAKAHLWKPMQNSPGLEGFFHLVLGLPRALEREKECNEACAYPF